MHPENCLSYWFPKILAAGLPVPRTDIVTASKAVQEDLFRVFDCKETTGIAEPFLNQLKASAIAMGLPCFLRSGHTSGKHDWTTTCYVQDPDCMQAHVLLIIQYGECSSLVGLPWDVWAVREYLPVRPLAVCKFYRKMPICREYRFFVTDGKVACHHPYWPVHAIAIGGVNFTKEQYAQWFDYREGELEELTEIACRAGAAVGGNWSIDLLETSRGWYVTDMARAVDSYHHTGCPHAPKDAGEESST